MFLDDIEVTVAFKRKVVDSKAFSYSTSNRIFSDSAGAGAPAAVAINNPHYEDNNSNTYVNNLNYDNHANDVIAAEMASYTNKRLDHNAKRLANYEHMVVKRDPLLPGELGRGVSADASEKEKEKRGFDLHAFNMLVSDKISVHRSLQDYRSQT